MGNNFVLRLVQFGLMHVWPIMALMVSAFFLNVSDVKSIAILCSVSLLFRPLITFSLGKVSLRSIGEYRVRFGDVGSGDISILIVNLALYFSFPVLLLLLFIVSGVCSFYSIESDALLVMLASMFIYFMGLTDLFDGVFRAENRFDVLVKAIVYSRIVAIILFIVIFFVHYDLTIYTVLFVLMLAELVCALYLLFSFIVLHKISFLNLVSLKKLYKNKKTISIQFWYAVPVVFNSISIYIYSKSAVLILGVFESDVNVAGFEMISQIVMLPMAMTIVMTSTISPVVGRMYFGRDQREALVALLSKVASFAVWLSIMSALFLLIFGPVVIKLYYSQYSSISFLIYYLSPLIVIKTFAQILSGEVAIASGHASITAKIVVFFGLLNMFLCLIGGFFVGLKGVAIAIFVTHAAAAFFSVIVLTRKLNIRIQYCSFETMFGVFFGVLPCLVTVALIENWSNILFLQCIFMFIFGQIFVILMSTYFNFKFHYPIFEGIKLLFCLNKTNF